MRKEENPDFMFYLGNSVRLLLLPSLDQSSMSEAERLNKGTLSESVILPKSHL